jgi:hypothetical protein
VRELVNVHCNDPTLLSHEHATLKRGDAVGNFGKHIGDTVRVRSMGHSIVGFIDFLNTHPDRDRDPLG